MNNRSSNNEPGNGPFMNNGRPTNQPGMNGGGFGNPQNMGNRPMGPGELGNNQPRMPQPMNNRPMNPQGTNTRPMNPMGMNNSPGNPQGMNTRPGNPADMNGMPNRNQPNPGDMNGNLMRNPQGMNQRPMNPQDGRTSVLPNMQGRPIVNPPEMNRNPQGMNQRPGQPDMNGAPRGYQGMPGNPNMPGGLGQQGPMGQTGPMGQPGQGMNQRPSQPGINVQLNNGNSQSLNGAKPLYIDGRAKGWIESFRNMPIVQQVGIIAAVLVMVVICGIIGINSLAGNDDKVNFPTTTVATSTGIPTVDPAAGMTVDPAVTEVVATEEATATALESASAEPTETPAVETDEPTEKPTEKAVVTEAPEEVNNKMTIYYYSSWSKVNIHFQAGSSSWTSTPGKAMSASSSYSGYFVYTIELGSATSAKMSFNNGSGTWDNNNNSNYSMKSVGTYTINNGSVTGGKPSSVSATNKATIYYYSPWATPYIYYQVGSGAWTSGMGKAMSESSYNGYFVYTIEMGAATSIKMCFNDGDAEWDNNGDKNYSIGAGTYTVTNGKVSNSKP